VRPVDAAWGSHGSRLSPARRDAAPSLGRQRLDALGNWRLDGVPTDRGTRQDGGARRRGWPRRSQRVGGVDVAGLAWAAARRRCSWRRPLRSGSSAVTNGDSLVRLFASLSSLSSDVPAAARRSVLHRPTSSFGGAALERGQNPNVGWWRWTTGPRLPSLAFEPRRRKGQGEIPGLPRLGPPGRSWRRRLLSLYATEDTGARRGGKRGFSSPGPGSNRARARPAPRRACRLGGPAAPRPACWCGETGGARPARCAGGVGEDRDADTRAPQGRDRGGGYGCSAA
jgi:hypothetical protein